MSTGERAGFRVRRVLSDPADAVRTGDLCYASRGFSLHAAARIDGEEKPGTSRKYRLSWAALLARVHNLDVEKCPHCGGKMRIVAVLTDPSSIRRYLEGTGQSADIPEIAPARAPPQEELDY